MIINMTNNNTLAAIVDSMKKDIDLEAGRSRARHVTIIPGQEAIYFYKKQQADALVANAELSIDDKRLLTAEASARGISEIDAAVLIICAANDWGVISSKIECKRIEAKVAIDNLNETATSQDVLNIAYPAIQILKAL